jgi:tetratricopeptide (TPR) repeat protein
MKEIFVKTRMIIFALTIFVILMIIVFLQLGRQQKLNLQTHPDRQKEYAHVLYNKGLYSQAIREYERYLDTAKLDDKKKANINYIIANIYMDRLNDYQNALVYYLKIRHFYPETKLKSEINQKIVECLERLGRSLDAQQEMEKATLLGKQTTKKEGTIIAKIGNKEITMEELNAEINKLPPYVQQMYNEKEKKLEFLQNYIAKELMYDTARRRGYDKDKEIIEQTFQIKKNLMIQKLVKEEIEDKINISDSDLKLYYQAHKEDFKEKDFEEVKSQVKQRLMQERQKEAFDKLVKRMMEAEKVVIFEEIFK